MPEACNFIKKETLAQVFSCKFCETVKNTFVHRTPPVAASVLFFHPRVSVICPCKQLFSFLVLLININQLRLFACILLWNSLLIIPKYISSRSIDLKASKTFSIKINLFDRYQTIFHFCFYWWTLFYRLTFPYCPKHCTKMKFFINFLRFGHIYYRNP